MPVLPHDILSTKTRGFLLASYVNKIFSSFFEEVTQTKTISTFAEVLCFLYVYLYFFASLMFWKIFSLCKGTYLFVYLFCYTTV